MNERCRKNPHPGATICTNHGLTQAGRAAAEQRQTAAAAETLVRKLWDPEAAPITDAVGSLQALAGRMSHAADVLGEKLETDELDGVLATAWIRILRELRQALEGMERLGIANRAVELQQGQADLVLRAVRVGLDQVPDMSVGQRNAFLGGFLAALGRGESVPGEVVA